MTTFKMSYDDFVLLSKYVTGKCNGSSIIFDLVRETQLRIQVNTQMGETADILIYHESTPRFAEVQKTVRLGDEV